MKYKKLVKRDRAEDRIRIYRAQQDVKSTLRTMHNLMIDDGVNLVGRKETLAATTEQFVM